MVLDSNSAAAQIAISMYQQQVTRNFPSAVSHALTAVQLAHGNAEYMHFAAAAMLKNGRVDSDLAT